MGRGRWGSAEEKAPPTAARRPAAGDKGPQPARGRRASRTLRALPPCARLLSRPGRGGAGAFPVRARGSESGGGPPLPPAPAPAPAPAPPPSRPCECRRRRRLLPRLESACWRSTKEEGGGRGERAGRLGLRRVRPRETRIARPREGRPGRGRCTPRAEAEPGPRRAPAARRAHPAPRRGLDDEFPGGRVSWLVCECVCASGEAGGGDEGGEAGAGADAGRSFGGSRARAGGPIGVQPGPTASRGPRRPGWVRPRPAGPHRLAAPSRARARPRRRPRPPGRPTSAPRSSPRRPRRPAPLLFPTPGFQGEFGEAVWAKAASEDAS